MNNITTDLKTFNEIIPHIAGLVRLNHPCSKDVFDRTMEIGKFIEDGHKLYPENSKRVDKVYQPIGLQTRQAKNYLAAYQDRDILRKALGDRKITVTSIFEWVAANRAVERLFKEYDTTARPEDKAKAVEKALELPRKSFQGVKERVKREGKKANVTAAIDAAATYLAEAKYTKATFDKASRYCRSGKALPKDLLSAAEVIVTALKPPEKTKALYEQLEFKFVLESGEPWDPFQSPKSEGVSLQ